MSQSEHIIRTFNIIDSDSQILIDTFVADNPIDLINDLELFLQENFLIHITTDEDIINGYDHDWSNIKGNAEALCRPKNQFECAVIINICYLLKVPMTFSAGRTNLTGSATPNGGIIISIAEIKEIGAVNLNNKKINCSPGVYLEDLRNHVINESNNKLIFPVDPTSRKEAMLGGSISCNASGFTPGEKGAMRYWIDGLELILPNGEVVSAERGKYISKDSHFTINYSNGEECKIKVPTYNRVNIKNASGPYSSSNGKMDFIDLIVGSEGIFGCITDATLRLQDRPSDYLNLFIKLRNEDEAINLYSDFSDHFSGDMSKLSGFEYFGENCSSYMIHEEYLFLHWVFLPKQLKCYPEL